MNIPHFGIGKALATSLVFGSLVLSVHADTLVLQPGVLTEAPQLYGGEFTAITSTLSNASYAASARGVGGIGFETFCMAYDQEFSYGQTLTYALTNHTKDNSPGTITQLTAGTAWLYSQFATGNIVLTTGAQDTAFQQAIWWLQSSFGAPFLDPSTDQYLTAVKAAFGGSLLAAQAAAGVNNFGVQIILTGYGTYNSATETFSIPNSYGGQGAANGYAQPQLYYSSVPEAGSTVALLGLSLLGIAALRKKFGTAK